MLIRRLQMRYKVGLCLIAIVSIFFQLVVQWQLISNKDESYIIDVAGRQRMFSQKITKDILVIKNDTNGSANDSRVNLSKSLSKFTSVHQNLKARSIGKYKGENTEEINDLYSKIKPYYDQLTAAAECYTNAAQDCKDKTSSLLIIEANFLELMDRIVKTYSRNLEQSLQNIQNIEFFLIALILALLLFEAFYIFKPAINLVESSISSLEKQKEISEKNFKLARIGEVSAGLVHEIKNPLQVIRGKCELLLMKLKNEELDSQNSSLQVEQIIGSIDRTNAVINGLLNASRSQQTDNLVSFDLNQCLIENLAFTKHQAREQGVKFKNLLTQDEIKVLGNPSHLSQVLLNIISNAIYEAKNSSEKIIIIDFDSDPNYAFLKIKNSGQLIPIELQEKIFAPFFTTKSNDKGNGLGLSVSKNLMTEMEGDLYLEKTNSMTSFVIKLKTS